MKTVMILAAGRGQRLKPITDIIPKPLCVVKGKPLIEHHISQLVQAGFSRIIINHAYLGGQIRRLLGNGQHWGVDILYSSEPPGGLETGGGIFNALPLIGTEPFVTVNADIFSFFNFGALQFPAENLAHLVLVDANASLNHFGDFGLTQDGKIKNDDKQFTYSGIACYRPEIFLSSSPGRYSIMTIIRELVDQNKVSGQVFSDIWFDIGSPERLNQANN